MSEPAGPPPVEPWHPPTSMRQLPPPPPPAVPPQQAPERSAPRRRRWLVPVIIVGCLVVFGPPFAGVFVLISAFNELAKSNQPLVEGEPASPIAANPMQCAAECFDRNSVHHSVASYPLFVSLGVGDTTHPNGTYEPTSAGELYRGLAAAWGADRGTPDQCVFAFSGAPYVSSLNDANADVTDLVFFIGTQENPARLNSLDQAARIFPDSTSAQEFMIEISQNIVACTEVEIGGPSERYYAQINPAPALRLPESVAAIGWTRTGEPGPPWRAYSILLQRGNLIVMNSLLTDGSISEKDFRLFVEDHANEVAAITPVVP